ncbi:glutamate receptor 2-like [Oculina patagonica]
MRAITVILQVCLILGNFIQRVDLSDRHGAIGVVYHPKDESIAIMLNASADSINRTLTYSHRLSIDIISIKANSAKDLLIIENLRKMSCAIVIFDLSFGDHYSFAFAEVLSIPLLSFKPVVQDLANEYFYSALPSYETYARAIVDVLDFCIGKESTPREQVAILFEDKYSTIATKVYSIAREMEKFKVDAIPELEMNDKSKFQRALEVLPKVGANYVLVICEPENLATILEKSLQLGAMNKDSRWFTLNMDLNGNLSKKCFKGLVGLQVNLTHPDKAKRMKKKYENERKQISEITYALVNDTLYAVKEAFEQPNVEKILKYKLIKNCFEPGRRSTSSAKSLLNTLNEKVKFNGISGLVAFGNETKSRLVERLDITNVQEQEDQNGNRESVLVNVGHWNANNEKTANKPVQLNSLEDAIDWTGDYWEELQCLVNTKKNKKKPLEGRELKVVTIEDSPFCIKIANQTEGKPQFEGFSIDLLEAIKSKMGFTYTLTTSKDGKMGSKDKYGNWNGLIEYIVNKKAHVAIGAITISAARELDVDFSKPFMDFKVSLLMQKPKKEDVNLFVFLQPFERDVWLSTVAVVIGITLLIFCLDHFSPSGYRATAARSGEGDGDELNLFNSLWFAAGSILQQGADNTPRSASGRVLAGAFWFFTLILISTYTANLAAYFTAKNTKSTINSLEDLAKQKEIKYGVLNGGSLYTFFSQSEVETYQTMFHTMKTGNTFVNSTKEGVETVRKGGFAYLTDGPYLDYYNRRNPCNTMMLENLLEAKSYGIALQRNSELTNQFSVAILKLREEGIVDKLRKKWWEQRSECPDPKAEASSTPMSISLDHMTGVFIVLAGGIVVSVVFLLVERRCNNLRDEVIKSGSMTSVKEQMDQPTVMTQVNHRPLSDHGFDTKTFNNIDNRRTMDVKDGARARDSLNVPRMQTRLPNVYAGAPESNL